MERGGPHGRSAGWSLQDRKDRSRSWRRPTPSRVCAGGLLLSPEVLGEGPGLGPAGGALRNVLARHGPGRPGQGVALSAHRTLPRLKFPGKHGKMEKHRPNRPVFLAGEALFNLIIFKFSIVFLKERYRTQRIHMIQCSKGRKSIHLEATVPH